MDIAYALEIAKVLAREAGAAILDVYRSDFAVSYKGDFSPLTVADEKANDIILRGLCHAFPQAGILSEESADSPENRQKEYCFIVDPLDGTKEFINRNDEFTVNIALAYNGIVIMGVVYLPVKNELYYGAVDCGAYYEHNGAVKQILASETSDKFKLAVSRSHSDNAEKVFLKKNQDRINEVIPVGSSIKGCLVASGRVDGYYRFGPTMEWDTAAMQAVCEAAGATVRQMDNSELRYNREDHLNSNGFYIINRFENLLAR